MSSFKNILLLVRKINDRGLSWMLDRIRQELRSPRHPVAKLIAVFIESLRVLIRQFDVPSNMDKLGKHLLVVYDLNSSAVTFDFAYFLAWAETFARDNGKASIYVLFVLKDNEPYNEGLYNRIIDEDSQRWRFNNILIPLANMFSTCVGFSVLPRKDSIKPYITGAQVFPVGYSETFKPLMNYSDIFKSLEHKKFNGVRASTQGIRYINKWLQGKNINTPIVCITLRKYGYDVCRNSNIEAWTQFADWVTERGYVPVFIPDTDACWEPDARISKYHVFNEGCWNLELRVALYEMAFVNYFYSNGCGALATLSKKIRYILMIPVLETSMEATDKVYQSYGWKPAQRRLNFAEANQLLSFKTDSFEHIRDEFLEFSAISECIV